MGIKVGAMLNPVPPLELSVGLGVQAEAAGYDSVWFPDHLMGWFPRALWTPEASSIVNLLPSPHLYLDPTVLIALVGQATERVTLGTGVTDIIRRSPPDSWMWPWTPSTGRNDSIAFRTPVEPTGPRRTSPADAVGCSVGDSSGAVSSPELYGGTWVIITVLRVSRTPDMRPESRSRNASSGNSRGVDQGVGDDQPMLTSWCHGVRSMTCSLTF